VWGLALVSLYKILFHSKALLWESTILYSPPPPTYKAYPIALLLRDHGAIYACLPTPPVHAIHHTILVMAISCKVQSPGRLLLGPVPHDKPHPRSWSVPSWFHDFFPAQPHPEFNSPQNCYSYQYRSYFKPFTCCAGRATEHCLYSPRLRGTF